NLLLAVAFVGVAVVLQLALSRRMRPKPEGGPVRLREVFNRIPRDLRLLLSAEIFIRWGDWFACDFAVLFVASILTQQWGWSEGAAAESSGYLLAIMSGTALVTYVPVAKWVDRSAS